MHVQRFVSLVICLFLILFFSHGAQAQASVYGSLAANSFGFSYGGDAVRTKSDSASIIGGAFYNFPIQSRLTAGLDGRVLYGPGSNGGTAVTGALRIGFTPHRSAFRPYFEVGVGIVSATADPGFGAERYSNLAATFVGGLDIRLTDSVDLRAVDYGATAGVSSQYAKSEVSFIDAGVVYHFHRGARKRQP